MREMRARGMGRQENARVLHLPKEMIEIERRMERQAAKALTQRLIGLNSKGKGNRLSKRIYHRS